MKEMGYRIGLGQFDPRRALPTAVLIGFILLTLSLLVAIRSDVRSLSIVNLWVPEEQGKTKVSVQDMNTTQSDIPNSSEDVQGIQETDGPLHSRISGFQNSTESNIESFKEALKTQEDLIEEHSLDNPTESNRTSAKEPLEAPAELTGANGLNSSLLVDVVKPVDVPSDPSEESNSSLKDTIEDAGLNSSSQVNVTQDTPINLEAQENREAKDWYYSLRLGFHNSMHSNRTWTEEAVESLAEPTMEASSNSSMPTVMSEAEASTEEESRLTCDVSEPRTDVCEIYGDVRIHSNTSSVFLVTSSATERSIQNATWKIRPYTRKWEPPTMSSIKEFTVRSLVGVASSSTPRCSLNHRIPAIIFSTGGFQGNFFHELTDILIPLFLTSHQYHGEVQFLIADFKSWWVKKYQPILTQLSRNDVINLDKDRRVHCFKEAIVGLRSHKELGIDPLKTPKGYSMIDFRRFLRLCYSLGRESVKMVGDRSGKKSKLIIISRKKSRAILNERRVVRMARRLGLKVIVAGAKMTKNSSRFAGVVNSADIMMGVHGAGLSNMVFLPTNATVIQIIPWGGLKWACRFAFGDPAMDMGLRYVEYEIGKQESSLIDQYPRNHPVFTDPLSIHKQGFNAIWSTFLDKQNVKLDMGKFRPILLEALQT